MEQLPTSLFFSFFVLDYMHCKDGEMNLPRFVLFFQGTQTVDIGTKRANAKPSNRGGRQSSICLSPAQTAKKLLVESPFPFGLGGPGWSERGGGGPQCLSSVSLCSIGEVEKGKPWNGGAGEKGEHSRHA